ncbi:MAG: inositol monophosphatase [Candidatus Omnitrophica bacterium]|nr:inositol monophosphatase [Candidatus Omnitrophota bacterium]
MSKIKAVAEKAAQDAGNYVLEHVGKLKEISHKGAFTNLVTDVDKGSEKIILGAIQKEFPEHSILAEESGEHSQGNAYRWVVDPLDGTTNFTHGLPIFCTSIAVYHGDSVKIGVIFDPNKNELFTAEEGKGAFLNGKKINVSKAKSLSESLIVTGFAYSIEGKIANIENFATMISKAQAVRRLGSAALDLCYVACGRFDGFWELGLSPWDTAAGELIAREAGGKVTTLEGARFDIFNKEILATNRLIHDEMSSLLSNDEEIK